MGRSVSYPSNAAAVYFLEHDSVESYEWDWLVEAVTNCIKSRFKSFESADGWLDREDRIILRNGHAVVTISEYCGIAAVALVPDEDSWQSELARGWCEQVTPSFRKSLLREFPETLLRRAATASNGESFYARITD